MCIAWSSGNSFFTYDAAGQKVSKINLTEKLGAGGIAEVFRAEITNLQTQEKRIVVLKIFFPSERVSQFIEGYALMRKALTASNDGYNYFLKTGEPFTAAQEQMTTPVSMVETEEALSAIDLKGKHKNYFDLSTATMEEFPLRLERLLSLLSILIEGREFLVKNGLAHLDVKQSNIFEMRDGTFKLGDNDTVAKIGTAWQRITSPAFTAPELYKNDRIGPMADVYAIGATLYLLATGKNIWEEFGKSFPEVSQLALLYNIQSADASEIKTKWYEKIRMSFAGIRENIPKSKEFEFLVNTITGMLEPNEQIREITFSSYKQNILNKNYVTPSCEQAYSLPRRWNNFKYWFSR